MSDEDITLERFWECMAVTVGTEHIRLTVDLKIKSHEGNVFARTPQYRVEVLSGKVGPATAVGTTLRELARNVRLVLARSDIVERELGNHA